MKAKPGRILPLVGAWLFLFLPGLLSFLSLGQVETLSLCAGEATWKGNDLPSNGLRLVGEVEFYYGSWIESEREENAPQPSQFLSLPSYWTGEKFEGTRLGKEGYASYRFALNGLKPDSSFGANLDSRQCSYRLYLNSELCATYGTLGKTIEEDVLSGPSPSTHFISVPESGTVIVTLEVGNSGEGGIFELPHFVSSDAFAQKKRSYDYLTFAGVGILLSASLVLLLSVAAEPKKRRSLSEIGLALSLSFHWITSPSGIRILYLAGLAIPYTMLRGLSLFFLLSSLCFLLLYLRGGKRLPCGVFPIALFGGFSLVGLLFLCLFHTSGYSLFAFLPLLFFFGYFSFLLSKKILTSHSRFNPYASLAVWALLFACLVLEALHFAGQIPTEALDYLPVALLAVALFFFGSFLHHFLRLRKGEAELREVQKNRRQLDLLALKGRFEPEALFNRLNVIQSLYHESPSKGEVALQDFSRHLRYSVTSSQKALVPFNEELSALLDHVAFENLRGEGEVSLLLNIEEEDFLIPPMILSPLFDQFASHCRNKNQTTEIEISSKRTGLGYQIALLCEGTSFDFDFKDPEVTRIASRLRFAQGDRIKAKRSKKRTKVLIYVRKRRTNQ